jgi:high-affinity Fe2+/Pb2+ permease
MAMEFNVKSIQRKWDKELLSLFFNHPNYRIWTSYFRFLGENGATRDEAKGLLRTPDRDNFFIRNIDIYCFVATRLPQLYRIIESKSIYDLIEIVLFLSESDIDTQDVERYRIGADKELANAHIAAKNRMKIANKRLKMLGEFKEQSNNARHLTGKIKRVRV